MAFPKDLRQRMINLMYLVLMAMLAINIDPSALQGYKTINNGMKTSYNAFSVKNDATVATIKAKAEEDKKENQLKYAAAAEQVNGISSSMDELIDGILGEFADESDDSKDAADKVMITDGRGTSVKAKIDEIIKQYTNVINGTPLDDEKKQALINNFALKVPSDEVAKNDPANKEGLDWVQWTYKGKPAIALRAILNQTKNDAKATEGQILDAFANEMDADKIDIPYDIYNLAVIPSSTYVENGQAFTAKINVGQSSSEAKNLTKIFVNGKQLPVNNEGFAVFKETRGLGEHSLKDVYAIVTNPQNGETKRIDMKDALKYKVINPSEPSAAVSADGMNVFYAGLENPVSVSASGMGRVEANCAGCASFAPNGQGGYTAKVTQASVGKKVKVNVSIDGNAVESKEFRVLKVPDPDIRVAKYKPGASISTASLAAQNVLRAELDNFPFDAAFKVVSFDLGMLKGNKPPFTAKSDGPRFSATMKNAFQRAGPGWLVVFRNIKVQGPDGKIRDVGSVTYVTK